MREATFGLESHVERLYAEAPRRLAFSAQTPEAFAAWKSKLRSELLKRLGLDGRERPAVSAEPLAETDCGEYVEHKYALDVGEGVVAPMYLLVPKRSGPHKPVLVFHGHNPSVQYVLGRFPDEAVASDRLAHDGNYAQALAQAGYFVCAVEQRGFGERKSRTYGKPEAPNSCRHLAFSYLMHGRTMIGERCWDGLCAMDYLRTRDDVVPGALAATGNSGGGTTALWLSALDERITVCLPSCYFCSFKASIMDLWHCECNYVPGILEVCEMGDLAASIAPRAFRAIAGRDDHIFPVAAVREQFETVRRAYELFGADDRCSLAVHDGPHAYKVKLAVEWLDRWL